MKKFIFLKDNIKSLLIFSIPLIIGQLGQILIGAGDVFIASKHSSNTLAAISIASAILATIMIFGQGLLFSISPVLSSHLGQKKPVKKLLKVNIFYTLILSAIFCLISLLFVPLVPHLGFEKILVNDIKDYILICSFSLFGAYIYQAIKEFLQAYERVFFANFVAVLAIFLNLALNAVLVFGFGPIPELGVKGLAISSLIIRTFMGLALILYCVRFFNVKFHMDKDYIKELIKVGYPISLSLFFEFLGFNIITLIIGRISSLQAATHNIVITLIAIVFMVPLAISNAVAVRVGYAYGRKDYQKIKESILSALVLVLGFMIFSAFLFVVFPEQIISFFTDDPQILAIGVGILHIAAAFQLFDGLQVMLGGVLKGMQLTKPVFYTTFISYWIIGIPLGSVLAFKYNMQLTGYWIGLAVTLFTSSIVLGCIILFKLKNFKELSGVHSR